MLGSTVLAYVIHSSGMVYRPLNNNDKITF